VKLPKIYSRSDLPVDSTDAVTHEIRDSWPHLRDLLDIPDYDPNVPVGLIVGVNVPQLLEPIEKGPRGVDGSPFAVKTIMGWTVCGPSCRCDAHSNPFKMNCVSVHPRDGQSVIVATKRDYDEELNSLVIDYFSRDLKDSSVNKSGPSCDDQQFIDLMEREIKMVNGHYQLPLHFRDPNQVMPNNRKQIMRLAFDVERRLKNNVKMAKEYRQFMDQMFHVDSPKWCPTMN
jgi:hypothetical protein